MDRRQYGMDRKHAIGGRQETIGYKNAVGKLGAGRWKMEVGTGKMDVFRQRQKREDGSSKPLC